MSAHSFVISGSADGSDYCS